MIAFLARSQQCGRRAIHANEFLDAKCCGEGKVRSRSSGKLIGFVASTERSLQGRTLTGIVLATDVPTPLLQAASNRLLRAGHDLELWP